jgi:hypothetical protein
VGDNTVGHVSNGIHESINLLGSPECVKRFQVYIPWAIHYVDRSMQHSDSADSAAVADTASRQTA